MKFFLVVFLALCSCKSKTNTSSLATDGYVFSKVTNSNYVGEVKNMQRSEVKGSISATPKTGAAQSSSTFGRPDVKLSSAAQKVLEKYIYADAYKMPKEAPQDFKRDASGLNAKDRMALTQRLAWERDYFYSRARDVNSDISNQKRSGISSAYSDKLIEYYKEEFRRRNALLSNDYMLGIMKEANHQLGSQSSK